MTDSVDTKNSGNDSLASIEKVYRMDWDLSELVSRGTQIPEYVSGAV